MNDGTLNAQARELEQIIAGNVVEILEAYSHPIFMTANGLTRK